MMMSFIIICFLIYVIWFALELLDEKKRKKYIDEFIEKPYWNEFIGVLSALIIVIAYVNRWGF
jgi:hypothetical protein